jgi:hypothetical protein
MPAITVNGKNVATLRTSDAVLILPPSFPDSILDALEAAGFYDSSTWRDGTGNRTILIARP